MTQSPNITTKVKSKVKTKIAVATLVLVGLGIGAYALGIIPGFKPGKKIPTRTINVTVTNDELDAGRITDCTAIIATDCSLREAISLANSASRDYIINVPAGTYTLTLANASGDEDNNRTGDLDITNTSKSIAIRGADAATTIIDANGAILSNRAFEIRPNTNVSIDKVSIQNGSANDNGGAIYCSGTLAVINSTISNNDGAGIRNDSNLSLLNSNITDNTNTSGSCAGIRNSGGNVEINNSNISNNIQTGTTYLNGVAVQNYDGGTMTIANSEISGNSGIDSAIRIREGNLTITNSTISNNINELTSGGAISNDIDGNLIITQSIISSNQASVHGGGINNLGDLTVSNGTEIIENSVLSSLGSQGGGIYNEGTIAISNTIISKNQVDNVTGGGGGLYNTNKGEVTISNSTITENQASSGGGLMNANFGVVSIANSSISKNIADFGAGLSHEDGTLTIDNTSITENIADTTGGGIYNVATGELIISNTVFSKNTAENAGAFFNLDNEVEALITNSTFSENSAVEYGGGLFNEGLMTIINSTFYNNTAGSDGGAITNQGALELGFVTINRNSSARNGGGILSDATTGPNTVIKNSIISDNKKTGDGSVTNCQGPITSEDYNMEDINTCSFDSSHDLIDTSPYLDSAGAEDNGGPTYTISLDVTSPAIDFIPTASCTDFDGVALTTDQRGYTRPVDLDVGGTEVCDAGAYEVRKGLITILTD